MEDGLNVTKIAVEVLSHVFVQFSKQRNLVENHAMARQTRSANVMKILVQVEDTNSI